MTNSVPVANLVGPYADEVLMLAAIIQDTWSVKNGRSGSFLVTNLSLAEAILSHALWPTLVRRYHPQEPAQPVPASDTAPEPIAEVLPASGEDWAAVVRKAVQPDGHDARVMLEIQQRLVAAEGPVVKAKPEPEPEPIPRLMELGLVEDLKKALDSINIGGRPLASDVQLRIAHHLVFDTKFGPLLLKALKQP